MVKTSEQITAKYAMKYDAYVAMIRSKHEHYSVIDNFAKIAFKQYSITSIRDTVTATQGLVWGVRGRYHDLTMKLFWKGEGTLQDFLDAGVSEAAYNQTVALIANLADLFYICAFPKSQLISSIFITPQPNEVPFTTSEDWLNEITSLSEQEANLLPTYPKTVSILNSKVCAHNVANTLTPLLNPPTVGFASWNLKPLLSILGLHHQPDNKSSLLNVPSLNWQSNPIYFENYSTYTSVDPNSNFSISPYVITVTNMRRDVKAYIYYDKGVGYFAGNFTHILDGKITASDYEGNALIWSMWNALGGEDELHPTKNGIEILFGRAGSGGGGYYYIYFREWYNNANYDASWNSAVLNTTYYFTITRVGAVLTVKIYSDYARNTLLATLTKNLHTTDAYRYIYAMQSCASSYTPAAKISIVSGHLTL
jgi:hypothetical protein